MTCRNCRFLDVKPDATGRRRVARGSAQPCLAPVPELPPLPSSITGHYSFPKWPPTRAWMGPDDGAGCPVREPLEGKK